MFRFLPLLFLTSAVVAQPAVTAAVFASKDTVLVGSQEGLRLLSWPDLKFSKRFAVKLAHLHDLAFSPAKDMLAIAGRTPGEEGAIHLLAWPGGTPLMALGGHEDVVHAVAWSPEGKRLVSASADGSCQVFEIATRKSLCTFKGHGASVLAVAWLVGGKQVLSAGVDQSLRLWDATTGKVLRVMENHTRPVNALAVRPGQMAEALPMVASASSDRTIRLWQPTIGRMMKFKRLPSAVLSIAWTGDGKQLLTGCADGTIRVIDPDSLGLLAEEKSLEGWITTVASEGNDVLIGGEKGRLKRFVPRR